MEVQLHGSTVTSFKTSRGKAHELTGTILFEHCRRAVSVGTLSSTCNSADYVELYTCITGLFIRCADAACAWDSVCNFTSRAAFRHQRCVRCSTSSMCTFRTSNLVFISFTVCIDGFRGRALHFVLCRTVLCPYVRVGGLSTTIP